MPSVSVAGIDLHYEELGSGEPVVFLHGLGSTGAGWPYQRDPFSERYRVIFVDLRGHGRSGRPPGPYTIPMFAEDVIGLLDALHIESAHFVGLSLGGMVGFQIAVDHPDRVRSLTVVNAGPEMVPRKLAERWNIWKRLLIVNLFSMEKIAEVIGERLFPEPGPETFRDLFKEGFLANDKASYKAATKALVGWSVADRIGQIRCPVLVVAADQDYTPVAAKEAYVARMPKARLVVIENSHHATPIDQADTFNATVLAFLDEAPSL